MQIELVFIGSERVCNIVEGVISEGLRCHPFFNFGVPPPDYVKVYVDNVAVPDNTWESLKIPVDSSTINHDCFPENRSVLLRFAQRGQFGLYVSNNPPSVNPLLQKLVAHEFAHFIDARLNQSFQYDHALRPPSDSALGKIVHCLWCSSIDGRLDRIANLSPFTLCERQEYARQALFDPSVVADAWKGKFATYPSLLKVAEMCLSQVSGAIRKL